MNIYKLDITVRGYELDSYGHVNNAVYLQYLEQARWELMRELKLLDYFTKNGIMVVVTESNIRYMREASLFDELVIESSYEKISPYLVFHHKIRNRQTKLANIRATIKTVLLDKQKKPLELPDFL